MLQFATLSFPRLAAGAKVPTEDPQKLRVIQAEYGHEVAVVTYRYTDVVRTQFPTGTPVIITYGRAPKQRVFVGTVDHIALSQEVSVSGSPQMMDVVFIGPTSPLNGSGAAQYRNVRADAVVSDQANRAGFSALVETAPFQWPLIQQVNQATWPFLVSVAQRVGWTLYPSATDIRCHSRAIRFDGTATFKNYGGLNANKIDGALYAFEIVHAETLNADVRKRDRIAQGVDTTGTVYTTATGQQQALSGPRFVVAKQTEYATTTARSIGEANAVIAGQQELNRHYIRAQVELSGTASVHPGNSVRLLNNSKDYDGYWYVERVEHSFAASSYRTTATVGRDSLGDYQHAPVSAVDPTRVVVHDGISIAPSASSLRETAPAPFYSDNTLSWRATAPLTRNYPSPIRRPPVVING